MAVFRTPLLQLSALLVATLLPITLKESSREDVDTAHSPVIGIDLGTTYSCVGVYKNGHLEIITNDLGNRITPAYVAFTVDGERLIGDAAENQLTSNPENTVFNVKRLIGRRWEEKSVQADVDILPYKVVNKNGRPIIEVDVAGNSRHFTPQEISAMVLIRMKETAEAYLGQNVTSAVITVPAYFNRAQRQATKDAGVIAGLNILRIINEPTAAALVYGINRRFSQKEQNILVYDLGGGTIDVSILTLYKEVFEVLSTNGDTHLGGEDFNQRVIEHLLKVIKKKTGHDLHKNSRAIQKLRREAERAKRALSSDYVIFIEIDNILSGVDVYEKLTRTKFEELNMDLFQSTLEPIRTALSDFDMNKDDIDEVLLVGGSTRIPKIQQLVKDFFNGKKPNQGINPDEAVAYGATVQASIFSEEQDSIDYLAVLDVNPLSMGIEIGGSVMSTLIRHGTTIPVRKWKKFSTTDIQPAMMIRVFEGERLMTKDNHLIGEFDLTGILPAPRGISQIEVTFELDIFSILKVTAKDLGTGLEKCITIQSDNRLSDEEIQRMINDAAKFAEQDKAFRERVDAKNDLESYLYSLQTQTKDEKLASKLSDEDKDMLEKVVDDKLAWLEGKQEAEISELKVQKKELEDIVQRIMSKLYQNSGGDQDQHQHEDL